MTRHKMSLSVNYVSDWGLQEALRELFQNAIDWGNWSWSIENGELNIVSHEAQLSNRTLLLGHSEKREGSIGKFGEGYKLAMLVLCRLGYECWIENCDQLWTPKLINSRTYKCQQLVFDVGPLERDYPTQGLVFVVKGLTEEDEISLRQRNLYVGPVFYVHKVNRGEILPEAQAGRMYVGGLFVCSMPEFKHGYNFSPSSIELDRDRRMLRGFDVSWATSQMWVDANDAKYAASLVKQAVPDVKYVESHINMYHDSDRSIAEELHEEFVEEYGEDAVPVYSQEQAEVARHQGHEKIVIVPLPVLEVMRRAPSYSPPAPPKVQRTPKQALEEYYETHDMQEDFLDLIKEAEGWKLKDS